MKKTIAILMFLMCAFSMNAQDLIVTNNGANIKAYNVEISDKYVFYTLDKESEDIKRIAKADILAIRKENGEKVYFDKENRISAEDIKSETRKEEIISSQFCDTSLPDIDDSNYHGFLMAKGNVVYVESANTPWEMAGAEKIRELLSKDGFWKVAARREQAHFIIRYAVSLRRRDHVVFRVFDTREGLSEKAFVEQENMIKYMYGDAATLTIHSSEEIDDNIKAAKTVYNKIIKVAQKNISKEKNILKMYEPFVLP